MNGNFLHDITATQSPVAQDSLIDGLSLGRVLFSTKVNFVGEPTTTMFRKAEIEDMVPDYMSMEGQRMIGVSDVCAWLNLLTKGDLCGGLRRRDRPG